MSQYINVTFLGTSSGGGPSESRNCSSLVVDMLGDGSLWMVDCAEGTVRQFSFQPRGAQGQMYLRSNRVTKVFITHMHADHTIGLIPLIRNVLRPPPTSSEFQTITPRQPKIIDVYGPRGIRLFVRTVMELTHTSAHPEDMFAVHELLLRKGEHEEGEVAYDGHMKEDAENGADDGGWQQPSAPSLEGLHKNELPGLDIKADKEHLWKSFVKAEVGGGEVVVDAAPIQHRDPCIGYVLTSHPPPTPHPSSPLYAARKLVILGDTSSPTDVIPLCHNPQPSLLIHEATDAYIPTSVDPQSKRSRDLVMEKCIERGHSTPEMAGAFAKLVGAKRVILNHLGARFPAPLANNAPRIRGAVLHEIERQASEAWGMGTARTAVDFSKISIPPERISSPVGSDATPFEGPPDDTGSEKRSGRYEVRGGGNGNSGGGGGGGMRGGGRKRNKEAGSSQEGRGAGNGNGNGRGAGGSVSRSTSHNGMRMERTTSGQGSSRSGRPSFKKVRTPEEG